MRLIAYWIEYAYDYTPVNGKTTRIEGAQRFDCYSVSRDLIANDHRNWFRTHYKEAVGEPGGELRFVRFNIQPNDTLADQNPIRG